MTRDEIMAMQPGRELDALVAEKVMGWKVTSDHLWRDTKGNAVWLMAFSTDISAAWEVVEKMRDANVWRRIGFRQEVGDDIFAIFPDSICRAALLAVMEVSE